MSNSFENNLDPDEAIWPIQETLGGQSTTQIFLHDVVSSKPDFAETFTVPGREKDIEKALAVARPNDLVCVARATHPAQIELLHNLGIGPDRQNIIRLDEAAVLRQRTSYAEMLPGDKKLMAEICRKLPPRGNIVLNPYISTPESSLLARELENRLERKVSSTGGTVDIVRFCIQKHLVCETARELDIPVAEGEVVELEIPEKGTPFDIRPMKEAVERRLKSSGGAIIKSAVAVLTSKIIQVGKGADSLDSALRKIEAHRDDSTYLVETAYDVTVSPNIIFDIAPANGPIRCVGTSDQLLSRDLAHQGNIFPSQARTLGKMLEAARHLSEWLQSKQYSGIVGYDFCEYIDRDGGNPAFFLSEVNPRINGSVYPFGIMAQLAQSGGAANTGMGAFISAKRLKVNARSFEEFGDKFGQYFFVRGKTAGFVPYYTSRLDKGIVGIVAFGKSPKTALNFFKKIQQEFLS